MSRSIFPIAASSMVSALAGVALTLVFAAEALETLPDNATDPLHEVAHEVRLAQARIDRMEKVVQRELGATRRDIHQALAAGGDPRSATVESKRAGGESAVAPAPHVVCDVRSISGGLRAGHRAVAHAPAPRAS